MMLHHLCSNLHIIYQLLHMLPIREQHYYFRDAPTAIFLAEILHIFSSFFLFEKQPKM